jgi:hypothetical protein
MESRISPALLITRPLCEGRPIAPCGTPISPNPVGGPPPARMRAIAPRRHSRRGRRSHNFIPPQPAHDFTRHTPYTLHPPRRSGLARETVPPWENHPTTPCGTPAPSHPVGGPPPARMPAIAPRRHSWRGRRSHNFISLRPAHDFTRTPRRSGLARETAPSSGAECLLTEGNKGTLMVL